MIRKLAVVIVAVTLFMSLAQPGQADPITRSDGSDGSQKQGLAVKRGKTVSDYNSTYKYVWIGEFNLCLGVYIHADVQAYQYSEHSAQTVWHKMRSPKLIDPYMQITVKTKCDDNASLKKWHRMNSVTFYAQAYGYKCSYDPSFSASFPWSVSVSATPDCGDERVARHGDSQTGARRATRFKVESSGLAFGWNGKDSRAHYEDDADQKLKICSSMSGLFTLRDTAGADRVKITKKVSFRDFCVRE